MRFVLLALFFLSPVQGRVIPATPMADEVKTGGTHGSFVWTDRQAGLHKGRITQAEYIALPTKPASLGLTDEEWADIMARPGFWYAAGGRTTWNTPSGEPILGTSYRTSDGTVTIYTGDDIDIGATPYLRIPATEYAGMYPAITTSRSQCGINIINGVFSGTLNEACARGSRSRAAGGK